MLVAHFPVMLGLVTDAKSFWLWLCPWSPKSPRSPWLQCLYWVAWYTCSSTITDKFSAQTIKHTIWKHFKCLETKFDDTQTSLWPF